ncbi:hypothetical protein [Thalassobacillus cyri]|uniref:hypothetical protein n=1 Tax=Thalassobacillus cyri TaxID=571932 RepID=UPI00115FA644|nr:hypothetical protein [Thalassobacillus cyri]
MIGDIFAAIAGGFSEKTRANKEKKKLDSTYVRNLIFFKMNPLFQKAIIEEYAQFISLYVKIKKAFTTR